MPHPESHVFDVYSTLGSHKGASNRKNVLTRVKIRLKYLSKLGIENKCWTEQSGQYFPKIRGRGSFLRFFESLFLKNGWRHQNVPMQ